MDTPTAGQLMTPTPAWCTLHDSIEIAARLMYDHDCGALPVVDNPLSRRPVGVVTDRDIVIRVVARGRTTFDSLVQDVMTPEPVQVHVDESFHDCVRAMMYHRIRRVLVVDDRGKLIGIVTDGDLARACRQDSRLEHEVAEMLEAVSDSSHPPPQSPQYPGRLMPAVNA